MFSTIRIEKNDLATKMPEKTEEMKNILLKLWADIKAEGPNEWWESDKQKSRPKTSEVF